MTLPDNVLNVEALVILLFFTVINERLVEYFISPIFVARNIDTKWLMYVSLVSGFLLGVFLTPRVFVDGLFTSPIVEKILTGIFVGGGSNLLHQAIPARAQMIEEIKIKKQE